MPNVTDSHLELERRLQHQVRGVAAAALAPVVALPLLFHLGVSYEWWYPKLIALQLSALVCWSGLLLLRPVKVDEMTRSSGVGLPLGVFACWVVASVAWSVHPWAAGQTLIELGGGMLALMGLANLFTETGVRRWFLISYGATATAACAAYVVAHALGHPHMKAYPFANPNVAASFALMPLTVGAAYGVSALFRRVPVRAGVIGGVVAVVSAAALAVSRSAAGTAACAVGLVLVAVFSLRDRARRIAIEVLCAIAFVVLLWPLLAPSLWPGEWLEGEFGPRPALWRGALELAAERPVQGLGPGTFFVEFPRVQPLEFAAHDNAAPLVRTAHCVPLHVFIEFGLIGLALLVWPAWRLVRMSWDAGRRAGHGDRALLRGVLAGLAAMLVQGLVSTAPHWPGSYVNVVVGAALIGGTTTVWWRRNPVAQRPSMLLRALPVAGLVVVFAVTAGRGALCQYHLHRAMAERGPGQLAARIDLLRRAIAVGDEGYTTLQARMLLAASYARAGHVDEALRQTDAVRSLAPGFRNVDLAEAELRLRKGDLGGATDALIRYCRKDPFDCRAYGVWAAVIAEGAARELSHEELIAVARPEEARDFLATAERHQPPRLSYYEIREFRKIFVHALHRADRPAARSW